MKNLSLLLFFLFAVLCFSVACKEKSKKVRPTKNTYAQGNFKNRVGNIKKIEEFWASIEEEKFLTKRQINHLKKIESNIRIEQFNRRKKGEKSSKDKMADLDLKKRLKFKEFLGDSLYILFAIQEKNIKDGKTKHTILKGK